VTANSSSAPSHRRPLHGRRRWFCFDVNTARSLRVEYPQTFWLDDSRFKLVQHGSLEADGRRARLDFEWLVPAGRLWRHVRETLWHGCWTDAEIRQGLRKAGFGFVRRSMASTFVRRCQA
jgi:hypothetical protein